MWYLVNNVLWALQEAICLSWCQTHLLVAFYQHAQVTIVTKPCDVDCMHPLICNSYLQKKIDTQNLWSIKPVKYGPQIFPWRPLIDRVVMYLRSGMTACLCWHTDSQTVWCTCWSHFVVTQEGDDNGWPSCWTWLSLMMMCLHNQWTIWPVAMAGKWSMKAPSNKPHL